MIPEKKIVAVCTSRIFEAQHYNYLKNLCEILSKNDIIVMIFSINTDCYWKENKYFPETSVFEKVPFDIIDLLVIMDEKIKSRTVSNKLIAIAKDNNVPVIVVDGKYEGTIEIRFDYKKGFERVVRHIIEHHHSVKPFFIAGLEGNPFSDERIEIFKKVLADNGIPFTRNMMAYGDFWAKPARAAIRRVLRKGNIPDAVICANDIMAINVMDVLINAGYKVPEDIMVSGFDGIDEVYLCNPKITTADCGSETLAKAVSDCIFECFSGNIPDKVIIEPTLLPNSSCGCHNNDDHSIQALNRFNSGFYRFQDDIRLMYDISTAMEMSETPAQAAHCMRSKLMHDIHCIIFAECLEEELDYFASPLLASKKDKLVMFFDSYNRAAGVREIDLSKMREFVYQNVRKGCPMIVNTLDYRDKPLGYICYTFNSYDFINYAKTASVTNTISMGLGGFICNRYQRYLSKKVEEMYSTDPLTGLLNRIGFYADFQRMLSSGELDGKEVTILMADLDGLKHINDNFGHEAGDNAIALSAAALKNSCPKEAIGVRFGGDEMFALIFGKCEPDSIIESIDRELAQLNSTLKDGYEVTMSCGAYSTVIDQNFDLSEAVRLADEGMYRKKRRSQNA